eukprot:CAMPEP_0118951970 /NCGR_PEP_ID=MMETSP1169-20130426/54003_1 /TAXON_ID=36882 /ORGANISM="Pyramimonas obovata, Strain CCMP722" /LENGTH=142 /DNA_ID=CAMNT_0006899125 /DNA_START=555 /DNA_END=979 /DNA_ORIENTATION=-
MDLLGYSARFIGSALQPTGGSPDAELFSVASRMAKAVVGDHVHVLRMYTNVFIGEKAVQWMLQEHVAESEKAALALGNKMLRAGYIYHVFNQHPFENQKLFYRCNLDPSKCPQIGGNPCPWEDFQKLPSEFASTTFPVEYRG